MIKQQHESDLSDPKERFVWAFRNLEVNGFPLAIPEKFLVEISEHLSRCGFVHDADQQEIHFQPPIRGQDHYMNLSGRWVPVEQPIQQPVIKPTSVMTPQEKAKWIQEFREEGLID